MTRNVLYKCCCLFTLCLNTLTSNRADGCNYQIEVFASNSADDFVNASLFFPILTSDKSSLNRSLSQLGEKDETGSSTKEFLAEKVLEYFRCLSFF